MPRSRPALPPSASTSSQPICCHFSTTTLNCSHCDISFFGHHFFFDHTFFDHFSFFLFFLFRIHTHISSFFPTIPWTKWSTQQELSRLWTSVWQRSQSRQVLQIVQTRALCKVRDQMLRPHCCCEQLESAQQQAQICGQQRRSIPEFWIGSRHFDGPAFRIPSELHAGSVSRTRAAVV